MHTLEVTLALQLSVNSWGPQACSQLGFANDPCWAHHHTAHDSLNWQQVAMALLGVEVLLRLCRHEPDYNHTSQEVWGTA
jgi:hypothetical protein